MVYIQINHVEFNFIPPPKSQNTVGLTGLLGAKVRLASLPRPPCRTGPERETGETAVRLILSQPDCHQANVTYPTGLHPQSH